MGPNVEREQDVDMGLVEDLPDMEILVEEHIGIGKVTLGEDRPIPKIQSHDSLLNEIEELKFLLRKSSSLLDQSCQDNESLCVQLQQVRHLNKDRLKYRSD